MTRGPYRGTESVANRLDDHPYPSTDAGRDDEHDSMGRVRRRAVYSGMFWLWSVSVKTACDAPKPTLAPEEDYHVASLSRREDLTSL